MEKFESFFESMFSTKIEEGDLTFYFSLDT